MYIVPILLLCPQAAAGAKEMLQKGVGGGWGCCWACRAAGLAGRGQAWAALLGRQTRANQHELASNHEECTQTCCGRACWNGTGTASNPASWNESGRNVHKYVKNMQLYVKYAIICKYIDCISQICRYAQNMPEICLYMHIMCSYMP